LCAATSYVTSLFILYGITLGLTRACNHANRLSAVNEYTFHVGLPEVLDVSLKMHIKCLVYTVQPVEIISLPV